MPFEIALPFTRKAGTLPPSRCILRRGGLCIFPLEALQKVGIGDGPVVVLFDRATRRIAIRKPADGEEHLAIRPRLDKSASRAGGVAYYLRPGFAGVGSWDPKAKNTDVGPRQLITRADGMAVVLLDDGNE